MTKYYKNIIGAGLLMTIVYSCSITKKYERPTGVESRSLYREVQSTDSINIASTPYQEIFSDTILQSLIGKGLENNFDLKIALARMDAASANLKQSKLAFFPSLSADAQVTYSQPSSAQARANGVNATSIPTSTIYALTTSTSWELDVWGKLSSTKKATLAAYLGSDAYRRAVQTQLIATVATGYYQLLAYDEQIKIVESTIENRAKDVDIVKSLKNSAAATGADVVNSEANVKEAKLRLPDLKQSRRELENSLSILLGMQPEAIPRSQLALQIINTELATGVPAQLLANRPDVQQAEFAFQNAFELTNVARTYFYPNLTISGSGGWATANTLQSFFTGTFYGSLIGGLTQPIFNKGLNKQRLQVAEATQQEAYYTFQNTLLTAGQEVSDALYAYQMALEKENIREGQISDLEKATDFTKELLRYSSNTNYTDVLTAEQNLLSAKLNSISDQLQKFSALVELYRALGGGWK
ncbi:TolC family protein [Empedobacter brevis]|uniref:TolC family protein n=1 Tax=Empedobacter brevis TaxID=247 RepID=UPI002FE18901